MTDFSPTFRGKWGATLGWLTEMSNQDLSFKSLSGKFNWITLTGFRFSGFGILKSGLGHSFWLAKAKYLWGGSMLGIVQFIRSVLIFAIAMGVAGTLVEATGCVGHEAALAHRRGGISFVWLNRHLVGK